MGMTKQEYRDMNIGDIIFSISHNEGYCFKLNKKYSTLGENDYTVYYYENNKIGNVYTNSFKLSANTVMRSYGYLQKASESDIFIRNLFDKSGGY